MRRAQCASKTFRRHGTNCHSITSSGELQKSNERKMIDLLFSLGGAGIGENLHKSKVSSEVGFIGGRFTGPPKINFYNITSACL